jgi:CHASE2 domain-containing sensor protein
MILLLALAILCVLLIGMGAAVHALFWLLIIGLVLAAVTGGLGYSRRDSLSWRRRP